MRGLTWRRSPRRRTLSSGGARPARREVQQRGQVGTASPGVGRCTLTLPGDPQTRNAQAGRLFDGIAGAYETPARFLSYFQYGRWHRQLVSRLELGPQDLVLDVCTGTGLVADRMVSSTGCSVVGLDLSGHMLRQAKLNIEAWGRSDEVSLVRGRAETLPFGDDRFDAVVFTFLLRYVEDVAATMDELARVLKPGGQLASLEFYVPQSRALRAMWWLHTRVALPIGARAFSEGWREVGSFLGGSISGFYREHTLPDLERMWGRSGMQEVRSQVLSLGGAVVTWGRKKPESGMRAKTRHDGPARALFPTAR